VRWATFQDYGWVWDWNSPRLGFRKWRTNRICTGPERARISTCLWCWQRRPLLGQRQSPSGFRACVKSERKPGDTLSGNPLFLKSSHHRQCRPKEPAWHAGQHLPTKIRFGRAYSFIHFPELRKRSELRSAHVIQADHIPPC
jgi:hypothetical protein